MNQKTRDPKENPKNWLQVSLVGDEKEVLIGQELLQNTTKSIEISS